MATLLGIALKTAKYAPMQTYQQRKLSPEHGLQGDHRGKPSKRQVTLMSLQDWHAACSDIGVELPWLTRRANLLVDHLPLAHTTGAHIRLGEALLEVTGETDPCQRMEQAHAGLFTALQPAWRGGVTCRVLQAGTLSTGMSVTLEQNNEESCPPHS